MEAVKSVRYKVENIHLSDRLNRDTSIHVDRIIEITPIVSGKVDQHFTGEMTVFQLTNELKIQSMGWGENTIKFICGDKEQLVTLVQKK